MQIKVNGKSLTVEEKQTVLELLDKEKFYLPRLCSFNLQTAGNCNMCIADINGKLELSCKIGVEDKMSINTETEAAIKARKKAFAKIMSHHPHICLVCDQKEGCDRLTCTYGIPVEERCCNLFEVCEIRKLTDHIGLDQSTAKFSNHHYETIENKLFFYNPNLCVGCERCVMICDTVPKAYVWQMNNVAERKIAAIKADDFVSSGCVFCGACVLVCPAGAININDGSVPIAWMKRSEKKLNLPKLILPPVNSWELIHSNLDGLPDGSGVYILYDESGEIIKIKGEMNMKDALAGEIENAAAFSYELAEFYTSRENELLSGYMKKYGKMPGADEMDDLF